MSQGPPIAAPEDLDSLLYPYRPYLSSGFRKAISEPRLDSRGFSEIECPAFICRGFFAVGPLENSRKGGAHPTYFYSLPPTPGGLRFPGPYYSKPGPLPLLFYGGEHGISLRP